MWLHRMHGDIPDSLRPVPLPACKGQSHVEALLASKADSKGGGSLLPSVRGAESSNLRSSDKGLRCQLDGQNLFTEGRAVPICSMFLAQASHTGLPAPGDPPDSLAAVALVLPKEDSGLEGTPIAGVDMTGATSWVVLLPVGSLVDVLDNMTRNGIIRDRIEEVFQSSKDDQVLGQGGYATVTCQKAFDNTLVAVKEMKVTVEMECIEREIAMLLVCVPHPNIIGYRGFFWSPAEQGPRISVVFDAAMNGDLLARVLQADSLTEAQAKAYFGNMMKGIAHIHSHDIVHRDIKAQNILLMSDDSVVVADFGLATRLDDQVQMARRCGSPGYVAPEVCLGKIPYGLKVDVFGAGVILYLMLSKEMPFSSPDRDTAATMRRTVKCNLHLRRPPWDGFSSALRVMLRETITREQEDRLSADQVLQHNWLTKEKSSRSSNSSAAPAAAAPAAAPKGHDTRAYLNDPAAGGRMAPVAEEEGEDSPARRQQRRAAGSAAAAISALKTDEDEVPAERPGHGSRGAGRGSIPPDFNPPCPPDSARRPRPAGAIGAMMANAGYPVAPSRAEPAAGYPGQAAGYPQPRDVAAGYAAGSRHGTHFSSEPPKAQEEKRDSAAGYAGSRRVSFANFRSEPPKAPQPGDRR